MGLRYVPRRVGPGVDDEAERARRIALYAEQAGGQRRAAGLRASPVYCPELKRGWERAAIAAKSLGIGRRGILRAIQMGWRCIYRYPGGRMLVHLVRAGDPQPVRTGRERAVIVTDASGNVRTFATQGEAARFVGCAPSGLCEKLKTGAAMVRGYRVEHPDERLAVVPVQH